MTAVDPQTNDTGRTAPVGLSSAEAAERRARFGPNSVDEKNVPALRRFLGHFWAPVPWMLEATVLLQIGIGQWLTAGMIATLLVVNVMIGFFQETRANAALALLKSRLSLKAQVLRDGAWTQLPAADLVPGDLVQISLGEVVPADVTLRAGSLEVDQSMLTGESIPVDVSAGASTYAGGLVRRGEGLAEVVATGAKTYFGRTAELVSVAHVESGEQKAVLDVVRSLTIVNIVTAVAIIAYAFHLHISFEQVSLLILTSLLSAVPVALPATFSLAAALGARTLATQGVLLTRLAALNDAAMIDVLCVDKTGTLTQNELTVSAIRSIDSRYDETDVLGFAALASSSDGQDPIDRAVRAASAAKGGPGRAPSVALDFTPFDPAVKMSVATSLLNGERIHIVKGAPAAIAAQAPLSPTAQSALDDLTQAGQRTLVVAAGPESALEPIGFVAFADPPRPDSAALLAELRALGVRTVMLTGDAEGTARSVARAIGLEGAVCPAGKIPDNADPDDFSVYAGIFPEQKFTLVKSFQKRGHSVGMCGDGANDAPALRQAQMGIAVSTATDVAKAAAGMVLTEPGLFGIVSAIKEGRSAFQRVLTFTLMLLINKCVTLVVLGVGLVVTGHAVLTPLLQVISMLTNDIVLMARTADRARPSPYPNAWRVRNLTFAAIPLGLFRLVYLIFILGFAWSRLQLSPPQIQTLTFVMLAFAGQGNLYVLRERRRLWSSRPAPVMILASLTDLLIVATLAAGGLLMHALPVTVILELLGATVFFTLAMDSIKSVVLSRVRID